MTTTAKPKHIGRNISRIRELRGMKQEALAFAIGVTQQTVSNIEGSETIEDDKLDAIAEVLGVSAEAIKNYSDEAVFNIIGNTVNNHDNAALFQYHPTFNPIDKLIESYEENKKLYERLVQAEKDKNEYLEKLLKGK
ncbi:helix-turn-helix domain-containing protein [Flavobacterium johnsoniae]|jgi:transcriptional regulator with XRE-family HTH domain|uniref:Plasmid maintenance system antidote protein, XRE family n=1 Tax=Flavobacterium johnsoniae (strain ATCC 17061 / DSM 2064 / JCM 8514 / BCRC 14874 / CCUG 350202 / NBRC 14942 / NCIMB 11054 / UW101) TaxID=376686 RepID=A5FHY7_FLAJ1|nr:helix-turn-helix transcriptional regulator [Flavobacterium johnsoniae]ABQ05185.1 plasmid maintenance system antidote protein, XRE family [Flavobacterium johnsoniae UW101]OXG00196.1 transcriptional regulator [Flavobacterium johnsoniae UW101]WQG83012.1 helix-turn-helix transcriptional regulator [Flavobacterium johnsoniae UW101]SHL64618.1 Helix-turn-helix [Flavobacterium johnsoniae]